MHASRDGKGRIHAENRSEVCVLSAALHVTERNMGKERRHRARSKVDTLTAVFDSPVSLREHTHTHTHALRKACRQHTNTHGTHTHFHANTLNRGDSAAQTEFRLIRLLVFPLA